MVGPDAIGWAANTNFGRTVRIPRTVRPKFPAGRRERVATDTAMRSGPAHLRVNTRRQSAVVFSDSQPGHELVAEQTVNGGSARQPTVTRPG